MDIINENLNDENGKRTGMYVNFESSFIMINVAMFGCHGILPTRALANGELATWEPRCHAR